MNVIPTPRTFTRHPCRNSNHRDLPEDISSTHWPRSMILHRDRDVLVNQVNKSLVCSIANAKLPSRRSSQASTPFPQATFPSPSIAMLTNANVKIITGAGQSIFRFPNRICARLHRNPPRADAKNATSVPVKWGAVLVAPMRRIFLDDCSCLPKRRVPPSWDFRTLRYYFQRSRRFSI